LPCPCNRQNRAKFPKLLDFRDGNGILNRVVWAIALLSCQEEKNDHVSSKLQVSADRGRDGDDPDLDDCEGRRLVGRPRLGRLGRLRRLERLLHPLLHGLLHGEL
jgi:hypothetical protein